MNILYWNKGYKIEIPRYASLSSVSYHSPFLDQPLVIVTIDTDFENMETCLFDEQIWTRGYSNIIELYRLRRNILESFRTKSGNKPRYITVS